MGLVAVVAHRIGIPHEIEPPCGHPFGMPRGSQQPVDQEHVCVGPSVGEIRIDFLRRRRQAGEVECHPAEKRERVGLCRRLDPLFLESAENEGIDPA